MKEVLSSIERKKQEFAKSELFEFMRDRNINPRQRLAFAPCFAPFVMSFSELNKSVFRQEPTNDPLQIIINNHTYEDDRHWLWFLQDLETLGINSHLKFNDTLTFLWNEETQASRWTTYQIFRYAFGASPIAKLAIIEAIEATGNVFFSTTALIARELQATIQKEFIYFGDFHLALETGRAMGNPESHESIENIQLTAELRQEAVELVEKVFELFAKLTDALLVYAKMHSIEQPFGKPRKLCQPLSSVQLT